MVTLMIEITSIQINIQRFIVNFDTTHTMHGPLLHNVTLTGPTFVGQTCDGHARTYITPIHAQITKADRSLSTASVLTLSRAAHHRRARRQQSRIRDSLTCACAGISTLAGKTCSAQLYDTSAAAPTSETSSG